MFVLSLSPHKIFFSFSHVFSSTFLLFSITTICKQNAISSCLTTNSFSFLFDSFEFWEFILLAELEKHLSIHEARNTFRNFYLGQSMLKTCFGHSLKELTEYRGFTKRLHWLPVMPVGLLLLPFPFLLPTAWECKSLFPPVTSLCFCVSGV